MKVIITESQLDLILENKNIPIKEILKEVNLFIGADMKLYFE